MTYTRSGLNVLDDRGVRIACCTDETAAMMILNALLAMEERSAAARCEVQDALIGRVVEDAVKKRRADPAYLPPMPYLMGRREPIAGNLISNPSVVIRPKHIDRREADEYACSCGLRWGVDEDDPHGA